LVFENSADSVLNNGIINLENILLQKTMKKKIIGIAATVILVITTFVSCTKEITPTESAKQEVPAPEKAAFRSTTPNNARNLVIPE